MKNLIPCFIARKFREGSLEGSFTAVALSIDISGFTAMTEAAMKHGKIGAEVVSDILQRLFELPVKTIYEYGGFITSYSGDGFTAIFQEDIFETSIAQRSLFVAQSICSLFPTSLSFGSGTDNFDFSVRIGLAYGSIDWGIIGTKEKRTYFFSGETIQHCCRAQAKADNGSIWGHRSFFSIVGEAGADCDEEAEFIRIGFEIATNVHSVDLSSDCRDLFGDSEEYFRFLEIFVGKDEVNFPTGEFRDVIPLFISFTDVVDVKKLIAVIFYASEQFGSSHPHLHYDDKGWYVLIFFGAPIAYENLIYRTLKCISSILNEVSNLYKIRVGVARGTSYCGFNGSVLRSEFTCLGKATNLAARLMARANWGEVIVEESITRERRFSFRKKGNFLLKGLTPAIPVFQLVSERNEVVHNNKRPLIGREKELRQLLGLLGPLMQGKFGGIVYISGPAGIGKSHLIQSLRENILSPDSPLNLTSSLNWFELQCDDIIRQSLNPVISFLIDYFGQNKANSIPEKQKSFLSKLEELTDTLKSIKTEKAEDVELELRRTQDFLSELIHIPTEGSLLSELDAKAKFENTLSAIKSLILAETLLTPTIIFIEDGQFLDADTKSLLALLTRNVAEFPFIILINSRFNEDGSKLSLTINELVPEHRIEVGFLSESGSAALIKASFQKNDVPIELVKMIYQKSEGNPFYIEQITQYFLEQKPHKNMYKNFKQSFEIPDTISEVIVARIDRLTSELKSLLKTASVLGREFSLPLLFEILSRDKTYNYTVYHEEKLRSDLNHCENYQLLSALSELKFIFKHALIQESIYQIQLKKQLRALHKLTAVTIEELYHDDDRAYWPELAYHYHHAGIIPKAKKYLKLAGDHSFSLYQNEDALRFYNLLLHYLQKEVNETIRSIEQNYETVRENLSSDERTAIENYITVSYNKADVCQKIGQWQEAREIFEKMLELSKKLVFQELITNISSSLGLLLTKMGAYKKSLSLYDEVLPLLKQWEDKPAMCILLNNYGFNHYHLQDTQKAIQYSSQALELAQSINYKQGICRSSGNLGICYAVQGQYDAALQYFETWLNMSEEMGQKMGIAYASGDMGNVYKFLGKYDKALECFQKQLAISKQIGDQYGVMQAYGKIGIFYSDKNQYHQAFPYIQKYYNIAREIGDLKGMVIAAEYFARISFFRGRFKETIAVLETHISVARKIQTSYYYLVYHHFLGQIAFYNDNFSSAIEHFNRLIELLKGCEYDYFLTESLLMKAKSHYFLGQIEAAKQCIFSILDAEKKDCKPFFRFSGHLLLLTIEHESNSKSALSEIKKLMDKHQGFREQAYLSLTLWKLTSAEKYKITALQKFQKLYKTTGDFRYKREYDRLS